MSWRVREATPDDVADIVAMVHELAAYEKAPDECTLTVPQLETALFGPSPALFGHVVSRADDDAVVGFAVWFLNYSTWRGVHGIYLEDLYVRPEARRGGAGRALLSRLAQICVERRYARLEWWVLDWNTPARDAYAAMGANALTEWIPYRVDGQDLLRLAGG
ncbi:GNAT family N-acetyltransferase [Cryptosporangium aurantiacum]|uniref:L-amino acid N-acyltransferase YncA n=1 Tax=Cryptosporangium aurantiacum TaxID=134849 RepID=A0A1M7QMF4_9ACTN|nr:GNAT family N-acetyltransferase [Cryptosporangium aurantiacum]SHN32464.1 L-amino acid N-acyltransferase YncA [Cryptosporangium aurantiacum]